ncbi:MAG: SpoIIIAH-like family protein [Bacilli bacterium]
MINKQNLWFVTLISLVLVLGVYYVTSPNELLKSKEKLSPVSGNATVNISENDMLVALRVKRDEKIVSTMKELESKLTSVETSAEDKNNAFEELKLLNLTIGKEEELEKKIEEKFKIKSFIEINNDQINVVINSKEHNSSLANNIMRSVQEEYNVKKYITVKFSSK